MDSKRNSHARTEHLNRALQLHQRYPVIDGHADSILMVLDEQRTLVERSNLGHMDWARALEAKLSCTVQTAWPSIQYNTCLPEHLLWRQSPLHPDPFRRVSQAIDRILTEIQNAGECVQLALTAADILDAHARGHLAVLINIEGAEAIDGELAYLRNFYRLGVRMMGLVWNYRNKVADGIAEEGRGGRLTNFGRQVVREMNRLGMLIDLSHITVAGFFDVLELSEHPVLFTHGNCRALWEHPRNLTDEQIRALAQHGGVFGISFVSTFMNRKSATLMTVADHIEHVVQLLGSADYVAYGSDFDGCTPPADLADVTRLPYLTAELLRRGYCEADLQKILGGNFLRVFSRVLKS